jgi:hypothetical protein
MRLQKVNDLGLDDGLREAISAIHCFSILLGEIVQIYNF